MLWHCYAQLVILAQQGKQESPTSFAALEGVLLHYRNLLDFLVPRPTFKDTDIVAVDFVAGFKAKRAPTKYRGPLDQHLSHLTYRRTRKRSWNIGGMVDELWEVWKQFFEQLNYRYPRRPAWFGDAWKDPRPNR